MSSVASLVTASSVDEAVAAIGGGARAVAGGTDLVVGARQGKTPLPGSIVAIHRLAELGGVVVADDGSLKLGALATHAEIESNAVVRERFTALADATAIVGSRSTRLHGTIGGNVMNASPAMETGGPLLCLGASATFRSAHGTHWVAFDDLFVGPGQTSAKPDELLTAIDVPAPAAGTGSAYIRLEYRRQMEIAVVGATAVVTFDGDVISDARVAITALAPTIHRVADAEAALVGTDGGRAAADAAGAAAAAAAAPISDVRASEDYRRAMAAVITRRAVEAAVIRAKGGTVAIPASTTTHGGVS
ncbi:MAG: FAD binding domain-containing protein [Gaiella sp.]